MALRLNPAILTGETSPWQSPGRGLGMAGRLGQDREGSNMAEISLRK